jgi:hypothetical protein
MRKLLPLGALVALALAGCSDTTGPNLGPNTANPPASCAGQSQNCGGGNTGNNANNPPHTAP